MSYFKIKKKGKYKSYNKGFLFLVSFKNVDIIN